jgi:hypothetical protein
MRVAHGQSRVNGQGKDTPTYSSWRNARKRCYAKDHNTYPNYGGRGITMSEEWSAFNNFFRDMGERPAGTSLDRIDPEGNYEPGNCRWADAKTQANNKRSKVAA